MKNRVDQRAIAEKLSLSPSTITKVLNYDPFYRVSNETKELIIRTAKEMGYEPRRRRTKNIAFVVCGHLASVELEMLRHVCAEASANRYRVVLVNIPDMPTYRTISFSVNPLTVDGAIITGHLCPDMAVQLSEILPVVTMGQYPERSGVDWIRADNRLVGKQLTERLLSCGHKNIGVIVTRFDEMFSQEMLEGYKQAFEEAGLEADLSMVWEKHRQPYPKLIKEMIGRDPKPTSLLAFTFTDHAVILSTLNTMGYRVPQDLGYVAWASNDTEVLATFPRVTCLDNLFSTLARVAVRRMMDRIDDRTLSPEDIIVPLEVRRGDTCVEIS